MKTALIYDWLVTMAGGEKALHAIKDLYPAPIYTLVHDAERLAHSPFAKDEIHTSFLQKFPFAKRFYRHYLPFFPMAIEQFDLKNYDLIISTSHAVAKGVLTHPHQLHLCYCLTPMRYAWDLTHSYLKSVSGVKRVLAKWALHYLRNWDIASLSRVDHFAAISHTVARRIKKNYGRESTVIYPPVDTHLIPFCAKKEEYYVTASRMVPYKKIDLIVEAFSRLPHKRLVVIGDGPDRKKIKAKAGKNIEILGHQTDACLRAHLGKARGFIFAAEEDFGIAPVEAQAAGTPVIAYGRGAALETVIAEKTGLFFDEQTPESLMSAVEKFEKIDFNFSFIRQHAERFSKARFEKEFKEFVEKKIEEHRETTPLFIKRTF